MRELTRPALRYFGGKWRLAPWIVSNFPSHKTYVETFGGAMSVLLRKPRSYAEVYNELDGEIVNLFRVLRNKNQADELERQLRLTPFARTEHVEAYVLSDDPIEMARRLLVKSFMGFGAEAIQRNTGFRHSTTRTGSIPAHDWAGYPDSVSTLTNRLRGVVIESRPAEQVMASHDRPDTLHYVDPPYVHNTRGMCDKYRFEMDEAQHVQLAAVLHGLRGMIVLSGYPCDLYESLYGDWIRIERRALADGAKERIEVLWMSPNTAQSQGAFALGAIA